MIATDEGARAIPEEVWRTYFADKGGNYGGAKFEQLSIDILEEYFSRGWRPTKRSHDGNKDFVLQCASERHWAESKAYRDPISYHVVSPTLFMAILGDAAKIIFLSRSAFRRTAKPLFAQYQRRTGRQVLCFDGAKLDNLVARSPSLTQKYFPGHHFTPLSGKILVTTAISPDVTRPSPKNNAPVDEAQPDNGELTIGLGEPIRVDVTLINETSDAAEVKIGLTGHPACRYQGWFEIVAFTGEQSSHERSLFLAAGEVVQINIILRCDKPVEKAQLPSLAIHVDGRQQEIRKLGLVTVSQLYRIGLTGKQHLAIRDAVLDAARHGRKHRIFQVIGRSGTGKSRLLQEIGNALAAEGYEVHRYDKEFDEPESSDMIVRALLADLNQLPLVPDTESIEPEADKIAEIATATDDELLTRLIYDSNNAVRQDASLIARALMRSTRARKTAIIIDNVQNVNQTFAETLEEMVALLRIDKKAPPVLLVLAVNLDLEVEGTNAAQLRRYIAKMAHNNDASCAVRSYQLVELTTKDVTQFIEKALHSPSGDFRLDDYPLTLAVVHEQIPRNPLHLWESLRYLRDAGILRLEGDILVVQDQCDSQLSALLRVIPPDLIETMRRRWEELQAATGRGHSGISGKSLVAAMRTASAIGSTSRVQLVELGVDTSVIDHLVRVGLLREGGFGKISFFHQRVFVFFQSEFYRVFPAEHARYLAQRLRKTGTDAALFQQFFVLLSIGGSVSLSDIRETAEQFCRRGASREFYRPYFETLLHHLRSAAVPLEGWVLRTFVRIGDGYQELESLRASANALEEVYLERVLTVSADALPGKDFINFAYRLIAAFLSIAEDWRALEVGDQAISSLSRVDFDSNEERELSEAKLLYQKLSVIKNFGRSEEALALGERALDVARRLGDRWLEIETLMDSAEVFLSQGQGRQRYEAVCRYKDALGKFGGDYSLPDPVPVRSFVASAIIALCSGSWKESCNICAEGIQYALRIRNHFWLIRLRLLQIRGSLCLAATGQTDIEVIMSAIKTTQDEMNTYAATRDVWVNHYLLGKAWTMAGNSRRAKVAFGNSVETTVRSGIQPGRLARRRDALLDMAMTLRALHLRESESIFANISDTVAGAECMSILRADDGLYRSLLADWRKTAFLALDTPTGVLTLVAP